MVGVATTRKSDPSGGRPAGWKTLLLPEAAPPIHAAEVVAAALTDALGRATSASLSPTTVAGH